MKTAECASFSTYSVARYASRCHRICLRRRKRSLERGAGGSMRFFFDSSALECDQFWRTGATPPAHGTPLARRLGETHAERRMVSEWKQEAQSGHQGAGFSFREIAAAEVLILSTLIASGLYRR